MMKSGAGEHEAIYQGNSHTGGDSGFEMTKHAASSGTVKIEFVAIAAVQSRNNERLTIHDEPDMSEETGVKDFVNSFGFVGAAIRQAAQFRAFGQVHCFSQLQIGLQPVAFLPGTHQQAKASGKFGRHATKMAQFVVSKKHHFPCNS